MFEKLRERFKLPHHYTEITTETEGFDPYYPLYEDEALTVRREFETLTSPIDCPVHGPIFELFVVGVITDSLLEGVVVGDDDRNIEIAEQISKVRGLNEEIALELVCERI